MNFEKINEKHLNESIELAINDYKNRCEELRELPHKDYRDRIKRMLSWIFKMELGVAAVQDNKVCAFLAFIPIDELFGKVKGVFAPMGASCFGRDNRGKMATKLFEYAAKDMVKEEILSFGVSLYGCDDEILKSFSFNGFGYRCCDGVRKLEEDIDIEINHNFEYEELSWKDAGPVLELHNNLQKHMTGGPVYFKRPIISADEWAEQCSEEKNRFFIAKDCEEVIGYLSVGKGGETFITGDEDYRHINGAFLKDQYRGKNIMQSLLKMVCDKLKVEGIVHLGVDCETINPNAISFWEKYFTSYTYSLTRRIDERVL